MPAADPWNESRPRTGPFSWLPLVLVTPFLHYLPTPGLSGFLPFSALVLAVVVWFWTLGWLQQGVVGLGELGRMDLMVLLFALLHLPSIAASVDLRVSVRWMFELSAAVGLYFVLSRRGFGRFADQWLSGIPLAVLFASALALLQFGLSAPAFMNGYLNETLESERLAFGVDAPSKAIGPFLHGNSLAVFLTMTVPIVLGLGLQSRSPVRRWVFLSIAGLGGLAQLASLSRGGMAALAVALMMMAALAVRRPGAKVRVSRLWLLAGLAGTALLVVLAARIGLLQAIAERFFTHDYADRDVGSNLSRTINLLAALRVVADRPFLGLGPGTSSKYYVLYGGWTGLGPHNLYLLLASERGLPVLAAFLLLTVALLRRGVRRFRQEPSLVLAALLAATVGALVNGLSESVMADVFQFFFFGTAGVLTAYCTTTPRQEQTPP